MDSESQEQTVGYPAQGRGCEELEKQEGEEGKSRRTCTRYGRINKGIRG